MVEKGYCWKCSEDDKLVGWVSDADGGYYQIHICKECAEDIVEMIEEKEEKMENGVVVD